MSENCCENKVQLSQYFDTWLVYRQLSYFLHIFSGLNSGTFENTVWTAIYLHFDFISVEAIGILSYSK